MNLLQFSKNVCFSLLINETCVCDIFSDHPLNTDTRIIQTLWHVSLVSMLTRFHCTSFTSVINGQAYSLVRDRRGGGAGRAAAPPLFCAPAPTFGKSNTMILFLFSIFNMKKLFSIVSPPTFHLVPRSLLVIVSEFETLAILANYICFTRWCPQSNHLK